PGHPGRVRRGRGAARGRSGGAGGRRRGRPRRGAARPAGEAARGGGAALLVRPHRTRDRRDAGDLPGDGQEPHRAGHGRAARAHEGGARMTEKLDALLRRHYRAAAGEIHADAAAVRRFRDAGHAAAHARPGVLRRWAFPALAAAVTAALRVAVAVLFWPGGRGSEPPRPMAPPATPLRPPASPTPVPEAPAPDRTASPGEDPTASPGERSPA